MIHEEIDRKLEARLRETLDEMIPQLITPAPSRQSAWTPGANEIAIRPSKIPNRSYLRPAAFGLVAAAAFAGFAIINNRVDPGGPVTGDSLPVTAATVDSTASTTAVPASTATVIAGTALAAALEPDGTVLVVNASYTDGLAGSLSGALQQNGYTIVPPINASGGVMLAQSAIYFHADKSLATFNAILNAVPIPMGENLHGQTIPGLDDTMLASADIIVMVGNDLAGAPWETAPEPLIDQGVGTLLVVDATTTPAGRDRLAQRVQQLKADGVNVADVVVAAHSVVSSMFMPLGQSTPWAFAVAELAGIDGFDTWDTTLVADPVPADVVGVLVITDDTPAKVLPTAMPAGFDDIADNYTTATEGADAASTTTRLFAGPGDQPTIVMLISDASVPAGESVATDGLSDFTEQASWPAYRLDVTRPSGRHDFIATGGLTAEQVQTVAESLAAVDVLAGTRLDLPFDLTEIPFRHIPSNAHGITWNGLSDQQITMYVEQSHGIDVFLVGISSSIKAFETPVGRVFATTDPTDDSVVQVGVVIDGQAINFEGRNVPLDEVVAMAASITSVSEEAWASRVTK